MSNEPSEPRESAPEPSERAASGSGSSTDSSDQQRYVVITPDGMGVAGGDEGSGRDAEGGQEGEDSDRVPNPAELVEQPAKVMRIGSMIKQLLEEVRSAPLDERGRARLAEIHARSITELEDGLAPELVEELERLALPLSDDAPTDAELRIAQAQLVGWLEGLFHGIQTALVAQQMAAQAQLQQMRQLPPGMTRGGRPGMAGMPQPGSGTDPSTEDTGPAPGTGHYL